MNDSTSRYRSKRDFSKTPEPKPSSKPARSKKKRAKEAARAFVVHRHEARKLHYDLRLEVDGVLKSWAVPKGFSFDPQQKHLAIRTEDHPIEYLDFSGVIPVGQYGAGTMTIWDKGEFEFLDDDSGKHGIEAGKLELRFAGGRLRGEWHMVRLKDPANKNQWLLFKSRDQYARGKDEPVIALDLVSCKPAPFPRRSSLMSTTITNRVPTDPDWLFELKLPGLRLLAEKRADEVRFRGTRRKSLLDLAGRIGPALQKLRAEDALVDGVLVAVDSDRRPSLTALEAVLAGESSAQISFYAFDLLYYDQWDVRSFPLRQRKAALASLIPPSLPVIYLDHEQSRAGDFMSDAKRAGYGSVIAKRALGTYAGGASKDWLELPLAKVLSEATGSTGTHSEGVNAGRCRGAGKVKVTNRGRVLWPGDGITKGELIDYYDRVADTILPYLRDRPLSLKRFPNGIEQEAFFQKHTPDHTPQWVRREEVPSQRRVGHTVRFTICNDRQTLLYLANLASIELHPWSSRLGQLNHPDWAIFDLDPPAGGFLEAVKIARSLGKLLWSIGLDAGVKTSGAKGLHVYVRLLPEYTNEQIRMFCEGVSRCLLKQHGRIATIERSKPLRGNRVYIDFMQNRRGQTIVAPYSVRPVPGATVSTPLDWDELNQYLDPSQFTIHSLIGRLTRTGDLFSIVLQKPQALLPAIDSLQDMLRDEGADLPDNKPGS